MALGLAVNARGADHNRSGAYEVDLSGNHDRLHGGEAQVNGAIETEDRAAIMDSLILCKFLRGVFTEGGRGVGGRDPFSEWARLLGIVTGWDTDADELQRTARRIVMAKRLFNVREGWTRDEDWLPQRFLSEPVALSSGRTATLTGERLESMIRAYYRARGLEPTGLPRTDTLAELDLVGLRTLSPGCLRAGSGQSPLAEED
jgi:aldehyde:ferredoxin oxidoreductase